MHNLFYQYFVFDELKLIVKSWGEGKDGKRSQKSPHQGINCSCFELGGSGSSIGSINISFAVLLASNSTTRNLVPWLASCGPNCFYDLVMPQESSGPWLGRSGSRAVGEKWVGLRFALEGESVRPWQLKGGESSFSRGDLDWTAAPLPSAALLPTQGGCALVLEDISAPDAASFPWKSLKSPFIYLSVFPLSLFPKGSGLFLGEALLSLIF